jgi:hypothetical protein
MKFGVLLRWVLVGSTSLVAACGSGASQFGGGQDGGSSDGTRSDGPVLNLGDSGGGSDAKAHGGRCNPLTCEKLGYNCGPAGDGCGSSLDCGKCTGAETCGGGGKFSVCGGSSACVPKTCTELGIGCGPAGDGCGGSLDCGLCKGLDTCGGGGKPSVCGSSYTGSVDGGVDGGGLCVPLTCADQNISCGPAGDGCGNALSCPTCPTGQTCGGGGTPAVCGSPASSCKPKTCAELNVNCGPVADGCGGLAVSTTGNTTSCGTCNSPDFCGGGGKPSVCGTDFIPPDGGLDGGACVPQTCASQNIGCGPAGDGCGNALTCPTCPTGKTCGGAGVNGQCGTPSVPCVPKTCVELGVTCGPAGDGCGGVAVSSTGNTTTCGTCNSPDICGGGGTPGVCGDVPPCNNLCPYQGKCAGGVTATLTGQVVAGTLAAYLPATAPNSPDPVPNVVVYVPNIAPAAFALGVQCTVCGADITGDPLAQTTTNAQGNFTLTNIPVPPSGVIPIVIQLGRWRRIFGLGNTNNPGVPVTCAGPNSVTLRMPRNPTEGDIPFTAISTGNVDPMECVLLKMGVDQAQFTVPGGGGRIEVYQGNGAIVGTTTPYAYPETTLDPDVSGSTTTLDEYDQVLFPCWGDDPRTDAANQKTANQQNNLITYTANGGRVFGTHFSYSWLYNDPPFEGTVASWVDDTQYASATATIVQPSTFADVNTFFSWMTGLAWNGATAGGTFAVTNPRNDFTAPVTAADNAELWMNAASSVAQKKGPPTTANYPLVYTFPYGTTATTQCGKVVYSDFHVSAIAGGASGDSDDNFPAECTTSPMSAQEKALEYLIWDLSSCPPAPPGPTCTPQTCETLGFNCGQAGDGCGNSLDCGSCSDAGCETCGGGGQPGVCGGTCCVPTTCTALGIQCGPAGNGCGGTLSCGSCPTGQTCGGGGINGQCGAPDGGTCVPETCLTLGFNCGPAGDGCGGSLNCGSCSDAGCQSCGGGGAPGVCGGSCCVPETCMSQNIQCGPAGDGCGGSLNCGGCPEGQICGGGGTDGVCGAPDSGTCVPLTCSGQGIDCGPAGNGCGGALSCGTCPSGQTCGGGGQPGKCGGTCTPKTCAQLGFNCGPAGNGCGGSLNCGTCVAPDTCGGGGMASVCGAPAGPN